VLDHARLGRNLRKRVTRKLVNGGICACFAIPQKSPIFARLAGRIGPLGQLSYARAGRVKESFMDAVTAVTKSIVAALAAAASVSGAILAGSDLLLVHAPGATRPMTPCGLASCAGMPQQG